MLHLKERNLRIARHLVLLRNRRDLLVRIGFLNQSGFRPFVRNIPFTRRGPSHPRALPRFAATMASSDSSLRFRYCEASRVPLLDLPDTRPSYAPPHPRVQNRFGRTASASQRLNCWPRGTQVTRLYEEGSFALRLTSLSGRTPAFGSPLSRPAVLITSRFVCDSCSFHHDSSAKLILAYQTLLYKINCICCVCIHTRTSFPLRRSL